MANINQLNVASIPVYNAQVPQEGPIAIPLNLDFTANTTYNLDIKTLIDQGFLSMVQTLFLDTTGLTGNLTVTIQGSNQLIIVKPNTQGYYPVICPNPVRMTFTNTGGTQKNFLAFILNMPIAGVQWPTV